MVFRTKCWENNSRLMKVSLCEKQRHLQVMAGLCFSLALFPVAPYADGYILFRLTPWVLSDTPTLDTVIWAILLMGPAVSSLMVGIILIQMARFRSSTPQTKSVHSLYLLLWVSAVVWICAIAFQVDDVVSGRLTGSELEGWLAAIGMYLCPITGIIAGISLIHKIDFGTVGIILSSSLNLGLFWFLLLAAGWEQLTPFSWGHLIVTALLTISGLSYITIYQQQYESH